MYIETEPIKVTFIVNYVTLSSCSVLHNMLQYKGLFPSRLQVLKMIQPFFDSKLHPGSVREALAA